MDYAKRRGWREKIRISVCSPYEFDRTAALKKSAATLKKMGPKGMFVFFFAGHG